MAGLSKSRILEHRQCPKRLWLHVYRPELAEESEAGRIRMALGSQVGVVARSLYPDGLLVAEDDLALALRQTQQTLSGAQRQTLFEATLQADEVLIRADVLTPAEDGYRLIEVKSSTSVKDYHYDDITIQGWVTHKAGVPLQRIELAHINNQFVYPGEGDYRGLFTHADLTGHVVERKDQVPEWIEGARATLADEEPDIEPGLQCTDPFECPFLAYCCRNREESPYPPEILPHGAKLAAELRAEGYADLRDVPSERIQKPRHQRIWRVSRREQPELDPAAGHILRRLSYPRYYIDFETLATAVPIWAGTRPYQNIPFQWSCHVERRDGTIEHHAFLADGRGDPRRAFAESLLAAVRKRGPILVYHAGFERGCLLELAETLPDLADALEAVAGRLVDLLPIAREHYYHPQMKGSWSLKAVLPTIAPELAYDELEVAHGGMAQAAFAEILQENTEATRREQLREALLTYCERDTLALIRIAQHFQRGGEHA